MKEVHVECYPDGLLVSKLGFTKKKIKHGFGKSRVLKKISKITDSLGVVDEDPRSPAQPYERNFRKIVEKEGLRLFTDSKGNKIVEIHLKLEDWILHACDVSKIDPVKFDLPYSAKKLHLEINKKLDKFGILIDELIKDNNPAILQLKEWLK